jgi:hypothetical protein
MNDSMPKETIMLEKKGDSVGIAASRGEKFRAFIDRWIFGNYGQRKPIIGGILAAAGGLASGGAINAIAAGGFAALYSSIFEVRRSKRLAAIPKSTLKTASVPTNVINSQGQHGVTTPGKVRFPQSA